MGKPLTCQLARRDYDELSVGEGARNEPEAATPFPPSSLFSHAWPPSAEIGGVRQREASSP